MIGWQKTDGRKLTKNYERLHKFTASEFSGIVLDGATRNLIIGLFPI